MGDQMLCSLVIAYIAACMEVVSVISHKSLVYMWMEKKFASYICNTYSFDENVEEYDVYGTW